MLVVDQEVVFIEVISNVLVDDSSKMFADYRIL